MAEKKIKKPREFSIKKYFSKKRVAASQSQFKL